MRHSAGKDYARIAKAISYLQQHSDSQPSVAEVATHVNLSESQFHRLFCRWAGVSPKQFLQLLTLQHCKQLLNQNSLSETSQLSGLSGTSRLYDHFVTITAITPGEWKSDGQNIVFNWGEGETVFGRALVVWTDKGIHLLEFDSNGEQVQELKSQWASAEFIHQPQAAQAYLDTIFSGTPQKIRVWIKGTNFQLQVWRALLHAKYGSLCCYQDLAKTINKPMAHRAVGSAVAKNPIAFLIPCHRVIRASGVVGEYRWGRHRKLAMLGKEFSHATISGV